MSRAEHCPIPERPSLNWHLRNVTKCPDSLRHLIVDMAKAVKYISYAIQTTDTGLSGSKNTYGEEQLALDILADDIIREHLCESATVSSYVSEEMPDVIELDPDGPYSIAFDPLDGSSLVDANFSIGSIFGVYKGGEIVGQKPRDQVAAFYALYGPRTIFTYSIGGGTGVHTFILNDVGEFKLLKAYVGIADDTEIYSPGNLRAISTNEGYKSVMQNWLDEGKTLRYSGCMVSDIHHIFAKGQGIFCNIGGGPKSKYPEGKLRHVFECGPFAYLVEEAGGTATDGTHAILDKKVTSIDQRTPLIIGSKKEVEKTMKLLV